MNIFCTIILRFLAVVLFLLSLAPFAVSLYFSHLLEREDSYYNCDNEPHTDILCNGDNLYGWVIFILILLPFVAICLSVGICFLSTKICDYINQDDKDYKKYPEIRINM